MITPNGDASPPSIVRATAVSDRAHVAITFSKPIANAPAVPAPLPPLSQYVPESFGYTLTYLLNLFPYTVDSHNGIGTFSWVADYLELQQPDGELSYVCASIRDAFGTDPGKVGHSIEFKE